MVSDSSSVVKPHTLQVGGSQPNPVHTFLGVSSIDSNEAYFRLGCQSPAASFRKISDQYTEELFSEPMQRTNDLTGHWVAPLEGTIAKRWITCVACSMSSGSILGQCLLGRAGKDQHLLSSSLLYTFAC